MKRPIALLLCLCAVLFAGCRDAEAPYVPTGNGLSWDDGTPVNPTESQAVQEDALVLVYYPDVTMNPYTCTDFTNRTLFSLIYQGLFTVDSRYNVSPMLCSRYTVSEDMRSYTFYLEQAAFSDGTALTAEDVQASYLTAMESTVYKGRFQHVESVTLSGDGGVTFTLDTPYEELPLLLDVPIVKASEVDAIRPLGTGPYYFEQTGAGARLRRQNAWWCSAELAVSAATISLRTAESITQIRDSFEFSDVGLVCADPCSDSYADYRCDYELWDCENGNFLFLGCNTENGLFSDPEIRAALTHAIDRDTLAEKFYRSFAHSATLPASPQSPYYSTSLAKRFGYDPDLFRQTLADNTAAGTTVQLLVNKDDTLRLRAARAIADMLRECGLVVQLQELSASRYATALKNRTYDLYLGQTRLSANMDLSAFFSKNGAMRYGGMSDPAMYALCLEALANEGNYYNLHQMVMEDGRLCPILFQSYSIHATRGLLTGLTPSRDNVFYYTTGKTLADALQAAQ